MRGFKFSKSKIHPVNTEIHFMNFAIPSGSRSWWGFRFPHTLDLDIFWCHIASTKCGRITEQNQKGHLTYFSGFTPWKSITEGKGEECHIRRNQKNAVTKHYLHEGYRYRPWDSKSARCHNRAVQIRVFAKIVFGERNPCSLWNCCGYENPERTF